MKKILKITALLALSVDSNAAAIANQPYYNTDKTKVQVLLGEIKASYRFQNANHTDPIEVDEITLEPAYGYVGIDNKHEAACFYKLFKNVNLPINSQYDYICIKVHGSDQTRAEWYLFNLNGNSISKGLYATGGTAAELRQALDFDDLLPNMSGYKVTNQAWSTYNNIHWNSRGPGAEYCIDIVDDYMRVYPGFGCIKRGRDMTDFSPIDYVRNVMRTNLPNGFTFSWRVWSNYNGKTNYGGDGYEGKVVVGR